MCVSKLGPNLFGQVQPRNETDGMHAGNQNPAGNQAPSGQTFHGPTFQSVSHVVQIPVAAGAIPIPSLNAVGTWPLFWMLIFFLWKFNTFSMMFNFLSFSIISANS